MTMQIFRRHERDQKEADQEDRLRKAERELEWLKARAWAAEKTLTDRQQRNHWQESITMLIQGKGA